MGPFLYWLIFKGLSATSNGKKRTWPKQKTKKERDDLLKEAGKNVDEVWAVFDKDDAEKSPGSTRRFAEAFEIAQKEAIEIAYSNEVFELWLLLLHFIEVNPAAPIPRADIYISLETAIKKFPEHQKFAYEHGKTEVVEVLYFERARA
jgi:hypothetical protein